MRITLLGGIGLVAAQLASGGALAAPPEPAADREIEPTATAAERTAAENDAAAASKVPPHLADPGFAVES